MLKRARQSAQSRELSASSRTFSISSWQTVQTRTRRTQCLPRNRLVVGLAHPVRRTLSISKARWRSSLTGTNSQFVTQANVSLRWVKDSARCYQCCDRSRNPRFSNLSTNHEWLPKVRTDASKTGRTTKDTLVHLSRTMTSSMRALLTRKFTTYSRTRLQMSHPRRCY